MANVSAAKRRLQSIGIADVRTAACAIADAIERTPTRHSRTLSQIAGCELYLKFENLQFTASFKERGALNKLLSLDAAERNRGVIAMSAGNHAQAVAYHAGRLGIPATIVMPVGTPFTKIKHTKDFGATVLIEGKTLTESRIRALEIQAQRGLVFVHPYDDPFVIAGQGTIALEMLADMPEIDSLVVPIGGGGLIAGSALAAKALNTGIDIYGVQTTLYPAMADAINGTKTHCIGTSIAEGIAVKDPGKLTRAIVRALVKDILLVTDSAIESAVAQLAEIEKTVVEGAGAAAFAAVLANRALFAGRKVGLVVSGGNIDMRLLSNVIVRELTREGRILSVVIEIEDRPGFLAIIATLIGEAGGNILDVVHNRLVTDMPAKSAGLSMTIEARDAVHAQEIREMLERAGFVLRVSPAAETGRHYA